MPSTTLSVSILNSTVTSNPLVSRTYLLIRHDDTRRNLRHPASVYSPECVEGVFSEIGSELIRRRHPIQEWAQPPLADRGHELEEVLLRCGVLQRTCVYRLVAYISVQLLDNLPRLLVAAPQVARCRARFTDPIVEHCEVDVERLRRRTVRPRLHVFGVRGEARWGLHAPEVRRVDNRLPLEALYVVEGLGDRAARDRHEHGLGLRAVTALSPDPPHHLVARPLPEIREPATDVAPANHSDLHFAPSPLQIEIGYSSRGHPSRRPYSPKCLEGVFSEVRTLHSPGPMRHTSHNT